MLLFIALQLLNVGGSQVQNSVGINSTEPPSHAIWDELTRKHVDKNGRVDYSGFQEDVVRLDEYLAVLSANAPDPTKWSDEEQIAYWINAYNAFTIKLVADHYPVESIKDIKRGIPMVNTVWDIKFIEIGGEEYDLNNIEHGILRKDFDEPRIHFAVNCASESCPILRRGAFTAENLDKQLTEQARIFLADESKNIIENDYRTR